jgi:DNA-binding NarL/FixJ family response regulator
MRDGKPRLLIADDEEGIRESLWLILQADYDVAFARDGQETLAKLTTERFDLALLDEMTWPEPCWGCWFAPRSPANHSRVKTLGDRAAAADRGDAGSVVALEQALRAESVVLPLWRPATLLAGKDVEGLQANSWSVGPFWHAERWKPSPNG